MKSKTWLLLLALHLTLWSYSQSNLTLDPCLKPFYHGVASGDPLKNSVIIWTRVTPDNVTNTTISGTWKVATDSQMTNVINSGIFTTNQDKDYTVKIDVTNLQPATYYYYQFTTDNIASPIGRTKTAPGDTATNARFGVVSCANLEAGYFNVYKTLSERNDVDAVLCLGDYIYEYETGGYAPNPKTKRYFEPKNEALNLADYRARYSVYHLDPDLRRNHQLYPWICIWDDHETANDSWINGAENHNANEGDWQKRKMDGKQAYFEWLPIRQTSTEDPYQIYREISYGNAIDLIMLDTRLDGREKQIGTTGTNVNSTSRKMITEKQKTWMNQKLKNTTAQWKFLVQQVMMAPIKLLGVPFNQDQWNGYPVERNNLSNFITQNKINNLIVLTGDIHTSWANDLPSSNYNSSTGAGSWGVEFVTPSVTSPGASTSILKGGNNFVKYTDGTKKGFVLLDVNSSRVQADWYHMNTIDSPSSLCNVAASWYVANNENHLRKATGATIAPSATTNVIQPPKCTTVTGKLSGDAKIDTTNDTIKIVSLYPNPSSDFITIHYSLLESGKLTLSITDLTGKAVKSFNTDKQNGIWTERYPIAEIPNGNYLVSFELNGIKTTQKIIISH